MPMPDQKKKYSQEIKQKALSLGFDACGIARAEELTNEGNHLKNWLKKGYGNDLDYMARNLEKRTNPTELVPGAKSVILLLLNYFPGVGQKDNEVPVISKYAYGKDYHLVVKEKLKLLFEYIKSSIQEVEGRVFIDSAPLLEKALAAKAGLGWIGKHSILISPGLGSFVFIGSVVLDIELDYDNPIADRCGSCTKCIDACPTGAILAPRIIDSRKCISRITIEDKGEIPAFFSGKMNNRVFGCDICQDVCPWNKNIQPTNEEGFKPNPELINMSKADWENLDENAFNRLFEDSAVKRTKFTGLRRNIDFLVNG